MCGICGIVNFNKDHEVLLDDILRMRDTMIHRGPDNGGYYHNGHIALGHRRLSIIDTSIQANQPLSNETEDIWIVYNGEFYNFKEFIYGLKGLGHRFKSNTDTEVIIHLYEEYGIEEAIQYITGMFSFAIVDLKKDVVFLVRDRFGIKPMYYYHKDAFLAFSSEIKGLKVLLKEKVSLRKEAFPEFFLFNRFLDYETFYTDIYELKPGHYLKISPGKIEENIYYHLPTKIKKRNISLKDALNEFDFLFTKAVKSQLISDVPLGVFLSGGVDSSLIAIKMSQLLDQPITTISSSYPDPTANELEYAKKVSKAIGSQHFSFLDSQEDFFSLLPFLTQINDSPIQTGISFYKAARFAKQYCTVMLCGQGADEIFGGYKYYRYANLQNSINSILLFSNILKNKKYLPKLLNVLFPSRYVEKFYNRLSLNSIEIIASYVGSMSQKTFEDLMFTKYFSELQKYSSIFPEENHDYLTKILLSEFSRGLQVIIQFTDRMTMAASVETRVPFLDHHLVEFVFSLPNHLKINFFEEKYLLKKYLSLYMKKSFVYRRKKGFPVPLHTFLNNNEADFFLKDSENNHLTENVNTINYSKMLSDLRSKQTVIRPDMVVPFIKILSYNHFLNNMITET